MLLLVWPNRTRRRCVLLSKLGGSRPEEASHRIGLSRHLGILLERGITKAALRLQASLSRSWCAASSFIGVYSLLLLGREGIEEYSPTAESRRQQSCTRQRYSRQHRYSRIVEGSVMFLLVGPNGTRRRCVLLPKLGGRVRTRHSTAFASAGIEQYCSFPPQRSPGVVYRHHLGADTV